MNSDFRNWSDLRVFLAVAREGSTLAASRKLGMAQPTVARRIDVLEHETGLTLFKRDTRGFRPTKDAKMMLPLAEAVEKAAEGFARKSDELKGVRPIRITAVSSNFSPRAAEIFNEFSLKYPHVSFDFLPTAQVLDLKAGEADIALRITRNEPDPDLVCRKISTAKYTLFGARSYADKYGLPRSPDNFDGHKFVTFYRDGASSALQDWTTAHVSPVQIVGSFSELELYHAAIQSGTGLGVTNLRMGRDNLGLIPCFDPPERLSSQHLMLINPESYRRPEIKAFTKFFAPRYSKIFKDSD